MSPRKGASARSNNRANSSPSSSPQRRKSDIDALYDSSSSSDSSKGLTSLLFNTCASRGSSPLSWVGLVLLCTVLCSISLLLHLMLDSFGAQIERAFAGSSSVLILFALGLGMVGVPLTHAAGVRRHGPLTYTFWQPFVGGISFIVIQIVAWTIWTVTIIAGIWAIYVGARELTSGWLSAVGAGGVISQLLVLVSLHYFVGARRRMGGVDTRASVTTVSSRGVRKGSKDRRGGGRGGKVVEEHQPTVSSSSSSFIRTLSSPTAASTLPAAGSWTSLGLKVSFLVILTSSLVLALFVESTGSLSSSMIESLQSLLTAAILLAVPATHLLARKSLTSAGYLLYQPFRGGTRFVTLQAAGWTLWTIAFISAGGSFCLVAYKKWLDGMHDDEAIDPNSYFAYLSFIPWHWTSHIITSAGVGGILSQALVLLSLEYFDLKIGQAARVIDQVRKSLPVIIDTETESDDVTTTTTILSPAKIKKNVQERVIYERADQVLRTPTSSPKSFVFPDHTEGGDVDAYPSSSPEPRSSRLSFADVSQYCQLALYRYRSFRLRPYLHECFLDACSLFAVSCVYLLPIYFTLMCVIPTFLAYVFHPVPWWAYAIALCVIATYCTRYVGRPSLTGAYSWDRVRYSVGIWRSIQRYFNGEIVTEGVLPASAGPYIFGFHPHGVYPLTCFWSTRCAAFRDAFPGLDVDMCCASIMLLTPLVRDIAMWTGAIEVSGKAIRMALKRKRSIMIVPGGQIEMIKSKADRSTLTLVTKHRGFIRMAIEHGTPLVPVLSIGEQMLMQNVSAPAIQHYTLRVLGVPMPIWPYGRWYSPLPHTHPVLVVYGSPIPVVQCATPDDAVVEAIHTRYYKQIEDMHTKYKHRVPGFEDSKLLFTEGR